MLTKLKIVVLAAIPSARVSTATAEKPGVLSNWRRANLRSFIGFQIVQQVNWDFAIR
jgi:hypothetical protein